MAAPETAHLVESSPDWSRHADCPGSNVAASQNGSTAPATAANSSAGVAYARLRKHADYQRAYKASRKQFSSSMTYFHAPQPDAQRSSPRVGITAGRVLGNAVERNRIKRRLREAIRANQALLPAGVDVILHPRRSVLAMDYTELRSEIGRIFTKVAGSQAVGNKAGGVKLAGDKSSAGSGSLR